MCDSPVALAPYTTSDCLSNFSHSAAATDDLNELSSEASNFSEEVGSHDSSYRSNAYKFQLQHDVQRLERQLEEEMQLRAFLEDAVTKNVVALPSSPCVPQCAQELLYNIAILEATVSKLEEEMISLQFKLSQERNERKITEFCSSQMPSKAMFLSSTTSKGQNFPSLGCLNRSTSEACSRSDSNPCQELGDDSCEGNIASSSKYSKSLVQNAVASAELKNIFMKEDPKCDSQPIEFDKNSKWFPSKVLWEHPNQLSEEMVRCMKNIFLSLAESSSSKSLEPGSQYSSLSPRGHLSNLSLWSLSEHSMVTSWAQSPQVDVQCNSEVLAADDACDPYRVHGKLSWADIGSYGLAIEVSWMSVGKKQLEFASGPLRRFRFLVEQLAKVNPIHLSWSEKLAFWINVYNALVMHAYLAYGVPRNDLKLFSLMQKAAYTIGGHSFSAAVIEYVILKMKPPTHRPQIALLLAIHKLRVTEEQQKFAMDTLEPLVAFALSCGMYSSPAVKIYTAEDVKEQLQDAQRDFIRASVGISNRGRLLVPKMLHCFAKNFVDDAKLAVWISLYLPPHQAAVVEQCIAQRRHSLLRYQNCGLLPFDSRFRYLFLPDGTSA